MAKKIIVTRAASSVWLVGVTDENFKTSKLPSRGEVLKVLFHHHVKKKETLKNSIENTASKLLAIWDMARIPTRASAHVIEQLRKLHAEWQGLKKNINRKSDTNLANQQMFQNSLDNLFDIAHAEAMSLIVIEEDRLFLQAQRETGRRGTMSGIDRALTLKEDRAIKRKAAAAKYKMKATSSAQSALSAPTDVDDEDGRSSSESGSSTSSSEFETTATPKTHKPRVRGSVHVVTPEVAAALDRTNTSDRKAAHILSALASTAQYEQNVEELMLSPSAIRNARIKHRKAFASEVKASFDPAVPLILHWDGKIMDDYTSPGHERVDRLPILVSGENVVKLLSVPKLYDGTAITMSHAVLDSLDEWGLRDRIRGLCFDTTASNTGIHGGVCVLLENDIGREMLHLACRRHVSEIVLAKVYSLCDVSKSPNLELFSNFKDFWPQIDQCSFSTAMDDENMAALIAPWREGIIVFAVAELEKFHPRDDYRELLELTIIFLGSAPPRGISFRYPGAVHRARWMARAIYAIKMWLFRKQYEPLQQGSSTERKSRGPSYCEQIWNHLKEVSLFVTAIYIRYWFQSPSSTAAPRNDLELLCELSRYPNKEIAKAATTAFSGHLWYLSELLVGFAFFDDEVSLEEKKLMVAALAEGEGSNAPSKRIKPIHDPVAKKLHDFVTTSTVRFFKILGLSEEFLQSDPSEWGHQEKYRKNQSVVKSVKVVNDLAERGVALIQEFNSSLTRNEEQKQYLLQVVEEHRKQFSVPTKAGAIKKFRSANC